MNDKNEKDINKIEYFTTIATSNKLNSCTKQINLIEVSKKKIRISS